MDWDDTGVPAAALHELVPQVDPQDMPEETLRSYVVALRAFDGDTHTTERALRRLHSTWLRRYRRHFASRQPCAANAADHARAR